MPTLLLLRHGQIPANRQGRWYGSSEARMTWQGKRQAARTARYLHAEYPTIAAVYTSPLGRCLDTAAMVGARLEREPVVVEALREYAIGEWEGMRFTELAERHDFVRRATRDPAFAPPGGESLEAVAARIVPAIKAIHASHGESEHVLIVGHGAALAVALSALVDRGPERWVEYTVANCSLTELVLSPSPYVNLFNSTRHL